MIHLMYVPGISRTDIPVGSGSDAYDYLATRIVASIDHSYYPAYYKDTIYIDRDDWDFQSTTINYLAIKTDNSDKTYYYFITDIRYVNESVYELDIVLDTITTFLPSIHINYGLQEREHIHYYTDSTKTTFNRNYIRENVSEGIFYTQYRKAVTNKLGMLVAKSTDSVKPIYTIKPDIYIRTPNIILKKRRENFSEESSSYELGYYYLILPYISSDLTAGPSYRLTTQWRVYDGSDTDFNNYHDVTFSYPNEVIRTIRSWLTETSIKNVYYFPFNLFSDITYNEANNEVKLFTDGFDANYNGDAMNPGKVPNLGKVGVVDYGQSPGAVSYNGYALEWMKDMKIAINRNVDNIMTGLPSYDSSKWNPFLEVGIYDENYLTIRFGENGAMSTFPTYKLVGPTYYEYYWGDPTSGARYYDISGTNFINNIPPNFYNTRVCAEKPLMMDLRTSEFEQWYKYNKTALIGAAINTGLKVATAVATHGVSAAVEATKMRDILKNPDAYTPKRRQLSKKAQRSLRASELNIEADKAAIIPSIADNDLLGLGMQAANLALAPDSVKTIGELIGDIMADCDCPYCEKDLVQDYYQVGLYYHMNGYKINKLVHNDNLTNVYKNGAGTKFNFVKFGSVTIDMVASDISVQSIVYDIEDRLRDGVRFWYVTNFSNFIGDYTNINVEW